MKKLLALFATISLMLAFSAPAFAANTTGGNMALTYNVAASYTVTIPDAVTITNGSGTQTVTVNARSLIPANESLKVKIASATHYDAANSRFRLKNAVGTDIYLGYAITYPTNQTVALNTAFLTAIPGEVYAGKAVVLTFTSDTAESAGTYSDTLTFAVSVS